MPTTTQIKALIAELEGTATAEKTAVGSTLAEDGRLHLVNEFGKGAEIDGELTAHRDVISMLIELLDANRDPDNPFDADDPNEDRLAPSADQVRALIGSLEARRKEWQEREHRPLHNTDFYEGQIAVFDDVIAKLTALNG